MITATPAAKTNNGLTPEKGYARNASCQTTLESSSNLLALQKTLGNQALLTSLRASEKPVPRSDSSFGVVLRSLAESGGQPLDPPVRALMESKFKRDFKAVRVHSDSSAAEAVGAVRARALTHGRSIFFANGDYQPWTTQGQKLLLHELTHVVQQRSAMSSLTGDVKLGTRDDRYEREATHVTETLGSETASTDVPPPIAESVTMPMAQRFESSEHVQLGDSTHANLSQIMGLLSSAEAALRSSHSAWRELVSARELWERASGDARALELLTRATHANDEARYEEALRLLEQAVPLVTNWVRTHPDAGHGRTRAIAGREHPEAERLVAEDQAPSITLRTSGLQVTYGEVIALGDFYPSPEAMHNAPREELMNREHRGILDVIRAEVSGRRDINFNQAYQEATAWRERRLYDNLGEFQGPAGAAVGGKSYATLARNNPEHFARENRVAWEGYHRRAVALADQARAAQDRSTRSERTNEAFAINAFGDHFLTDAFSAGHLLHKSNYMRMAAEFWRGQSEEALDALTSALLNDHWWSVVRLVASKVPIPVLNLPIAIIVTAVAPGYVRNNIKSKIRALERQNPDLILNAAVKVAHDHYGATGVEVRNARGDSWRTFGDDHLRNSPATAQLASLAVLRSRADIREALSAPVQSDIMDAWSYTPVPPEGFDETAFAEARALMLREHDNPLANLFVKNLPSIQQAEAQEKEENERDEEARHRRNRYQSYLNFIRTNHRIEDRDDSDDVAREIVANERVYASLTFDEKVILVLEMLEGFTGDEDEHGILAILGDLQRRGQLRTLLQRVPPRQLRSDINGAERNQLDQILTREGVPAN